LPPHLGAVEIEHRLDPRLENIRSWNEFPDELLQHLLVDLGDGLAVAAQVAFESRTLKQFITF
jgi:hypothetical protein